MMAGVKTLRVLGWVLFAPVAYLLGPLLIGGSAWLIGWGIEDGPWQLAWVFPVAGVLGYGYLIHAAIRSR